MEVGFVGFKEGFRIWREGEEGGEGREGLHFGVLEGEVSDVGMGFLSACGVDKVSFVS